jgi:hypothetical protein
MPFSTRKLPNRDRYEVYNIDTGEKHAKSTTKRKAESQLRLLNYIRGTESDEKKRKKPRKKKQHKK